MGWRLVAEVLNHAPAELSPAERLVLVVLAESANDNTRLAWPGVDVIAHRSGLLPGSVGKVFLRLRDRKLELRVPVGVDKVGQPVFAHAGRRTTYRIPMFAECAVAPVEDERSDDGPTFEETPDQEPTFPEMVGPTSDLQGEPETPEEQKVGPSSAKGRTVVGGRSDDGPTLLVIEPSSSSSSRTGAADASPPSALRGAEDDDDEKKTEKQKFATPDAWTAAQRSALTTILKRVPEASPNEAEAIARLILAGPGVKSLISFAAMAKPGDLRVWLDRVRAAADETTPARGHLRLVTTSNDTETAA